MNINELPVEMLMKIFSYLPRYEEVLLVSKHFYNVACEVNDENIILQIDDRFFMMPDWLPSVMQSTRQISKVKIHIPRNWNETQFQMINAIIKTFSATIKYLRLVFRANFTVSELLDILPLIPNVKHLYLQNLVGINLKSSLKGSGVVSRNIDLHLLRMEKLEFFTPKEELLNVFNLLPVGVLKELKLSNIQLTDTLTRLLKRQTNLKKLSLRFHIFDEGPIPSDIFENLRLDSLELWFSCQHVFNLAMLLAKQTKLKYLKLYYANFDEEFVNFLETHLTELETFSMNAIEMPLVTYIPKIIKLKSLVDFSVSLFGSAIDELKSLVKIPNSKITMLSIRHAFELYAMQVSEKSVPNLKVLKLYDSCISTRDLNEIMRVFNFVEVLIICRSLKIELTAENPHLNVGDCFNPKLKKLTISGHLSYNIPFLDRLISDYPNLKILVINPTELRSIEFRRILNGFTKLESLILLRYDESESQLSIDDLNYLKGHKNNLKFIQFNDLNFEVTDELKRQLSVSYDMVNYDSSGKLTFVKGIRLSKEYLFDKMLHGN